VLPFSSRINTSGKFEVEEKFVRKDLHTFLIFVVVVVVEINNKESWFSCLSSSKKTQQLECSNLKMKLRYGERRACMLQKIAHENDFLIYFLN